MKNYIKALERILILSDRIEAIEKKQAERFPMLVRRLDRIEGSFPAIVDRLNRLEKKLATTFKITCKRTDELEKELAKLKKAEYFRSGTAVPVTKDSAEGGSW